MLLNKTILSFLYYIIHYIAYTPFVSLFFKANKDNKRSVFFAFVCAVFATFFYLLLPQNLYAPTLSIFNILPIFIISRFIFNLDKNLTLEYTLICSLILFVSNILCMSFNILPIYKHYLFYESIMFFIVVLTFYKIIFHTNIKNFAPFFKLSDNTLDLDILSLIILLSFNFTYIINLNWSLRLFIVKLILSIFILQKIKTKILINTLRLSILNKNHNYNNLKLIVDDIRMFKHDYNNTLCSIGGYISLNDMNGLKNFYTKLTADIIKTNNTQMITPKIINEPSIYNILMSKYNEIVKKNLCFDFYSRIDYKKINILPYDFSKILGILLDNAIDAAEKSKERKINLSCEINRNKDFEIVIKNTYINKDVNIDKIYLKGYSSKKIKSGLGLWEVSRIIKLYPNISLDTKKDNIYFVQKLIITS